MTPEGSPRTSTSEVRSPLTELSERFPAPAPATRDRSAWANSVVAAARPRGLSSEPDLPSLLRSLQRRWFLALVLGAIAGTSVAALAWFLMPPAKYQARAMLHVSTARPKIVFDNPDDTTYTTYQRTQVALLKSRLVLKAALADPRVSPLALIREHTDPIEWLEKDLVVDFPGGSEILVVGLAGDHPADLPKIVNAIVDSYLSNVIEGDHKAQSDHYKDLKKIYDSYQVILEDRRTHLNQLAESVGSADRQTLAWKQRLALEHLDRRKEELLLLQGELRRLQIDLAAKEATERSRRAASGSLAKQVEQDPRVGALNSRIAQLSTQLVNTQRVARNGLDASLVNIRRELQRAKDGLAPERERARATILEAWRTNSDEALAETRERVSLLKTYEATFSKELEGLVAQDDLFNKKAIDLQTKQEQITLTSETAKKVGTLMESIEVEVKAPPRIKLLDRADVPKQKDTDKQMKVSGAAGFGVFCCTLLGISLWEFRARRVRGADDLVDCLGIPLVGTMPAVTPPHRRSRRVSDIDRETRRRLTESICAARTVLLHASRADSLKTLLVTSAAKGEGKTTLSSQLAISVALAGYRTLLIDCDLRSPALHHVFNVEMTPGLSEYLRDESPVEEVVHPTPTARLSVMPAGVPDDVSVQGLALDRLQTLIQWARSTYDYVIVDSPPVLPVADALLVSQHVDAVLFSTLCGESRLPRVYAAHGRMTALGARILGVVVMGVEVHEEAYY